MNENKGFMIIGILLFILFLSFAFLYEITSILDIRTGKQIEWGSRLNG